MEKNKEESEENKINWKTNTKRVVTLEKTQEYGYLFCVTFKEKNERDKSIMRQVDVLGMIKKSEAYKNLDTRTKEIIINKGVIVKTDKSEINWILKLNNEK